MADNVTRELLAMVVRLGAIMAILGGFYVTVGLGGNSQTLAIGAAAAFGSQAAAFTVRRLAGDQRAKPLLIALFAVLAIAAAVYVVVTTAAKPMPPSSAPAPSARPTGSAR